MSLPDPQASSGPRRRVWLIVAAAVVVVVVIVAIVVGVAARRAAPVVTPAPTTATESTSSQAGPSSSPSIPATSAPPSPSASTNPTGGATSAPAPTSSANSSATSGNQQTKSPVPLDDDEEVKPGLTAEVDKIEAVTGQAEGPGEVGGPAIRFTVKLVNAGDQAQPLDTTVVNVYYGDQATPASSLSGPGVTPLPDSVRPGAEVSATYVFTVPRASRDKVLITVDYSVDTSVVAFRGRAPR
ncbi:MAG TPA: hypothetical protein VIT20_11890 [Propionibacteriaceae bacterium]